MSKHKVRENFFKEFKTFIARGSVVDLAVGVIVGGAFGKIVTSLVNDILMPIVGVFLGGIDFTSLSIDIGDAHLNYGSFLQNIIDFLVIAFCVFIIVRIINRVIPKPAPATPTKVEDKPVKTAEDEQTKILKEIRDSLKNSK